MTDKLAPKKLYRYYGNIDYARSAIENNKLYMSSATQFNDPFDLNIVPITDISEERIIKFAKSEFEEKKTQMMKEMDLTDESKYYDIIETYFKERKFATEEGRKSIESGAIFGIVSHGVCCFTELFNNMHFWANYAGNHTGICLEFTPDYRKLPFNKLGIVEYQHNYPEIAIDEKDKYKQFFQIKHIDWEFEKEWRLIIPHTAEKTIEFAFYELSAIFCGCNIRPNDKEKIKVWLLSNRNVARFRPKLYSTEKNQDEFGLRTIEIRT